MNHEARTLIFFSLFVATVGCGKKDDAQPHKAASGASSPSGPGSATLPIAGPPACKPPPEEFPAVLADLVARAEGKPGVSLDRRYVVVPYSDGWVDEHKKLAGALRDAGWTVWTSAYEHLTYKGKATTHSVLAVQGTQLVALDDNISDEAKRHGIKVSIEEMLQPLDKLAPIPAGEVDALSMVAYGFRLAIDGNHFAELESKLSGHGFTRHAVDKDHSAFISPDQAVVLTLKHEKTSKRESTEFGATRSCREP
jgi:hypothetical protein